MARTISMVLRQDSVEHDDIQWDNHCYHHTMKRLLIFFAISLSGLMFMPLKCQANSGSAVFILAHYEFYNDNGAANAATSMAAQDAICTNWANTNIRLRLKWYAVTSSPGSSITNTLFYSKDGGSSVVVPTVSGSDLIAYDSPNYTNNTTTTERLSVTSDTWLAGYAMDTAVTTPQMGATSFRTELNGVCDSIPAP